MRKEIEVMKEEEEEEEMRRMKSEKRRGWSGEKEEVEKRE